MKGAGMRALIHRSTNSTEQRDLLLAALDAGATMKRTKKGLMIFGPTGSATAHFTSSDWRALRNLRTSLRRAGLDV